MTHSGYICVVCGEAKDRAACYQCAIGLEYPHADTKTKPVCEECGKVVRGLSMVVPK